MGTYLYNEDGERVFVKDARRVASMIEGGFRTSLDDEVVETPDDEGSDDETPELSLSVEEFEAIANVTDLTERIEEVTDKETLLFFINKESAAENTRNNWVTAMNNRLEELN